MVWSRVQRFVDVCVEQKVGRLDVDGRRDADIRATVT